MKTFKPTTETPEERCDTLMEYLRHQDAQKITRLSPTSFVARFGNVFAASCAISPLTIAVAFGAPFQIALDEETGIVAIRTTLEE